MIANDDPLKKAFQIATLIGFCFVGAVMVYGFIIHLAARTLPPEPQSPALKLGFYFLSALALPEAFWLRKLLLKRNPQDSLDVLIGKLQVSQITLLALGEFPAIMGVILHFLGYPIVNFYLLAAYSLVCIAVLFPRWSQWQEFTAGAPRA